MRWTDVTRRRSRAQRVSMIVRGGATLASLPLRVFAGAIMRRADGHDRAVENAIEALRELEEPAPELDGLSRARRAG